MVTARHKVILYDRFDPHTYRVIFSDGRINDYPTLLEAVCFVGDCYPDEAVNLAQTDIGYRLFNEVKPRSLLHFVGFKDVRLGYKDERYERAVKVFGPPDFVHRIWDMRAQREIADYDIVIFADPPPATPSRRNAPDLGDWPLREFTYDDSAEFARMDIAR